MPAIDPNECYERLRDAIESGDREATAGEGADLVAWMVESGKLSPEDLALPVDARDPRSEVLVMCKGAFAALSQPKTYPIDIEVAKSCLASAIAIISPNTGEEIA
jgi:hypothetical protein